MTRMAMQHYDTISAFIKSIRGSDPDAALYWLAKMLYAGEDIRFIARRLVISASEDIGMADPQGSRGRGRGAAGGGVRRHARGAHPLAHATVYLATAPKSNRADGDRQGLGGSARGRTLAVPPHLRDTHTRPRRGWITERATSTATTTRAVMFRKRTSRKGGATTNRPTRLGKARQGTPRPLAKVLRGGSEKSRRKEQGQAVKRRSNR